jgi:acid phosphatase
MAVSPIRRMFPLRINPKGARMTEKMTGDCQFVFGHIRRRLTCVAVAAFLSLVGPTPLHAFDCPAQRQPNIPKSEEPALNIAMHKKQLRAYKANGYGQDIKLVLDDALAYVMSRADKVQHPAVVLDIDETSLSNWRNIDANDFGFIGGGACPLRPAYACGFSAWINSARAKPIEPTLKFYDAVRAKHVAVFFVTGRHKSERAATIRNLHRAGFDGWTTLRMRPDDDKSKSIVPFKRAKEPRSNPARSPTPSSPRSGISRATSTAAMPNAPSRSPTPFILSSKAGRGL